MSEETESAEVARLAVAGMESQFTSMPEDGDSLPFVIVPDGYGIKPLDGLLPHPTRKKANVKLTEEDSFIGYVKAHKTDSTVIFTNVTPDGVSLLARLDYHGAGPEGVPSWGDHRAGFIAVRTVEWNRWMGKNGQWMSQIDFAEHLERCQEQIKAPAGAEVLELVQTLEGIKNASFKAGTRLTNGQVQVSYIENIELTGGVGHTDKIIFPSKLTLQIQPFKGGTAFEFQARLRHRIGEKGSLAFMYETVDPHLIIEQAANSIVAKTKKELADVPIYSGSIE